MSNVVVKNQTSNQLYAVYKITYDNNNNNNNNSN